ncbi:hypothetical protein [Micromonospora sp. WMMC273]|uniref:hypothetical protein n=1 Tax=Micromonospora sp. WMMC273 TaxID=3015157 RepID=UPI0022B67B0A|nr:hypothetical protein [Micromonospora sp. WMMC273]MCZ7478821.1 hypothetical protein [Micromonospora sp. WMMC273]MCZ7478949.1 hypothetical protein [Micromonospora sp. WMMC273]
MTGRRTLLFGLACLTAGWIAAGLLEEHDGPIWLAVLVFLALVLAVAIAADLLHARRAR